MENEHVHLRNLLKPTPRHLSVMRNMSFVNWKQIATTNPSDLSTFLSELCEAWFFGKYQVSHGSQLIVVIIGRLTLKTKRRLTTMDNVFSETLMDGAALFPLNMTPQDPMFFIEGDMMMPLEWKSCNVARLLLDGPYSSMNQGLIVPSYVTVARDNGFYPWQESVIQSVKSVCSRTVN